MFDRLRQQNPELEADSAAEETPSWMPDAPSMAEAEESAPAPAARPRLALNMGGGLSLAAVPVIGAFSPFQRFVLAFLLFVVANVFGCLLLVLFGRIGF
jgi:hypothetical protein